MLMAVPCRFMSIAAKRILFDSNFHARMFVTGANVYSPATGSAAAAFAGMIQKNDKAC